jgi:TRAP-type transport system periplasmic protein
MEILQDFNFAAYCPYATDANLFVVSFAVVMNKTKWDSLPADVKKVLEELRREQAEWTGAYVDNHVKEALAWSKQKYGHQVFQLSAADRAAVPKLVKPIVDEYVARATAQGVPATQILDDISKLRKKYEKKGR